MRTKLIVPVLMLCACASDPAPGSAAKPIEAAAPAASAPRANQPTLEELAAEQPTLAARVAKLATGHGSAFMALGTEPAVYMVWNRGRRSVAASCDDGDAFSRGVFTRANAAAKDGVQCNGNVCVHHGADERRTAFAFRPDGSLAGVLENVETSDAAGTDDEVWQMEAALKSLRCPTADHSMDGVKLDTTAD